MSLGLFKSVLVRTGWVAAGLTALLAVGCGPKYAVEGTCARNEDCVACSPCGCFQVYSKADVDTATCDEVTSDVSCDPKPDACLTGAHQAVCVSGRCQAVN